MVVFGTRSPRIVDGQLFGRLCQPRELIHDRYDDALDLATLARTAGVSRFHFLRSFAQVFGETPHQRLQRVRLEHAKERLRAGASVTEACFDVGFASLGSFSRLFHRRVGVSPQRYQRELRRLVQVPSAYALLSIPWCFASYFGSPNSATLEKRPRFSP